MIRDECRDQRGDQQQPYEMQGHCKKQHEGSRLPCNSECQVQELGLYAGAELCSLTLSQPFGVSADMLKLRNGE
jgi:hypothetical protein